MSAVTKLFIVLNVVFSLLLTAAVVVFVNKVEDFKGIAEKATLATSLADASRKSAEERAVATETSKLTAAQEAKTAFDAAIIKLTGAEKEVVGLKADKIGLSKDLASRDAQIQVLSQSLAAGQQNIADGNKALAAVRESEDKLALKNSELDLLSTKLQKTVAQLEREIRFYSEQVAELKGQNEKLQARAAMGGAAGAATPVASVPISGVIRRVTPLEGMLFATISVGLADKVEKGMTFVVVSDDQYMGKLTVTAVEPNEAFGRLEGPRYSDVKPDMQVRSQL